MSRNKDIKLMHDITGNPYRVCRAKLKENKWDLLEALDFGDALRSKLVDSVGEVIQAMVSSFEGAAEILSNLKLQISMPLVELPELPDYTIKEAFDEDICNGTR